MRYIVKSVVCDYGVFEKTDNREQLKVICDSLSNAELIADILNTDLKNTKYKAIKPTKIDKATEEIIEKSFISDIYNDRTDDEIIKVDDVLEILKRIGE